MQKALFPMKALRVTQNENGQTSHKGSLAMDFGGKDTGKDPIYAPCDMRIIRVRQDSSHETYAESLEPVEWADGTVDYMNFTFMHDDVLNPGVKAGAVFKQGQHFFDEGSFGGGRAGRFASHLHLEVGRGKSPARQVQNSYGTYVTPGQVHIYDALFLPEDCVVMNDGGHAWKRATENNNQEDSDVKMKICRPMKKELSSQLRLENADAIAGRMENGKLMAYLSNVAREYTPETLSQVKDEMTAQMQDGDLLIFTD